MVTKQKIRCYRTVSNRPEMPRKSNGTRPCLGHPQMWTHFLLPPGARPLQRAQRPCPWHSLQGVSPISCSVIVVATNSYDHSDHLFNYLGQKAGWKAKSVCLLAAPGLTVYSSLFPALRGVLYRCLVSLELCQRLETEMSQTSIRHRLASSARASSSES